MSLQPNTARTPKPGLLQRAAQYVLFLGGYCMFGTLGLLSSLACLIPAALFRSNGAHLFGQKLISRLFLLFVWYLRITKLFVVDASELAPLRKSRGLILVANHPSLLDVVFVIAHLPRVFCLMKASITRNAVLCGQAFLAGYVVNESGPGLIKTCQKKLRNGENLLIFPEGTRSTGSGVHPFKMGFAMLAKKTGVPVQTIHIHFSDNVLGKGRPFFQKPAFPVHCRVRLGKRFEPHPGEDTKAFGRRVENFYSEIRAPRTSACCVT